LFRQIDGFVRFDMGSVIHLRLDVQEK
jgi:hypothetical protein